MQQKPAPALTVYRPESRGAVAPPVYRPYDGARNAASTGRPGSPVQPASSSPAASFRAVPTVPPPVYRPGTAGSVSQSRISHQLPSLVVAQPRPFPLTVIPKAENLPIRVRGPFARVTHSVQRKVPFGASVIQLDRIHKQQDTIDVGNYVRAREGYVYIPGDDKVYKCFANLKKGQDAIEAMDAAVEAGIQVPTYMSYNAQLEINNSFTSVVVLQMKYITGQVFYASKPGGASVFTNRINRISNKSKLKRIGGILQNAKEAGMTDPQGIITEDDLLYFFDVHIGKGTGNAVNELINAVDNRLEELQ